MRVSLFEKSPPTNPQTSVPGNSRDHAVKTMWVCIKIGRPPRQRPQRPPGWSGKQISLCCQERDSGVSLPDGKKLDTHWWPASFLGQTHGQHALFPHPCIPNPHVHLCHVFSVVCSAPPPRALQRGRAHGVQDHLWCGSRPSARTAPESKRVESMGTMRPSSWYRNSSRTKIRSLPSIH